MSIKINLEKCVSCGKCLNVCPGNLIDFNENNKAYIKYPNECWGCTACLKECNTGAINYYLEPNIGGCGALIHTKTIGKVIKWII